MFTGIIEEIGTVRSIRGGGSGVVLDIEASKVLEGTATGDSIAVNGVCLTVTPGSGHFTADAMPETLRRTSLGGLRPGSKVNLERAMACGGRFGGHLVSGHVDACGRVTDLSGQCGGGHAGAVCGAAAGFFRGCCPRLRTGGQRLCRRRNYRRIFKEIRILIYGT